MQLPRATRLVRAARASGGCVPRKSGSFVTRLEGNRCGGYRSEILQSRLSSEDNDKTDLGPLIGIADCTVVPQPGHQEGSRKCKISVR